MIRWLLIAILVLLIARAFWRLMDGVFEALGGTPRMRARKPPVKLVRDPVCGMHLPPDRALPLVAGGTTHYFCSNECRERFRKHA